MSCDQLQEVMRELRDNTARLAEINRQCATCTTAEFQYLDQQAARIIHANSRLTRMIRKLTSQLLGTAQ